MSTPQHRHREAYCLMWYACPCGHRERFWNSRDGVTPFGLNCPSCGSMDFLHELRQDTYAPNHQPHRGQGIWRDGTEEEARAIVQLVSQRANLTEEQMQRRSTMSLDQLGFNPGWPFLDRAA